MARGGTTRVDVFILAEIMNTPLIVGAVSVEVIDAAFTWNLIEQIRYNVSVSALLASHLTDRNQVGADIDA